MKLNKDEKTQVPVGQGDLAVKARLAGSFILGMEQGLGGGFVARAPAFLLAVLGV